MNSPTTWRIIFNFFKRLCLVLVPLCLFSTEPSRLCAQDDSLSIRQLLQQDSLLTRIGIRQPARLRQFYSLVNQSPAWLDNLVRRDSALALLEQAGDLGLSTTAYRPDYFKSLAIASDPTLPCRAWLLADMQLSDALLRFFADLNYGSHPALAHDGLPEPDINTAVATLLAEARRQDRLSTSALAIANRSPLMTTLLQRIRLLNQRCSEANGNEAPILSTRVHPANGPLVQKLYLLGFADSPIVKADSSLRRMLRLCQKSLSLLADGQLRSTSLEELNQPVASRLAALRLSLAYYRWLYSLLNRQTLALVNIPSASLVLYAGDSVHLRMRMIVGKPLTPTPALSAVIDGVELYPYWVVPHSIIAKEWLPAMQRDPDYAAAGNFQVLDRKGKRQDPAAINWKAIPADGFPYIVRQATGCDNALGLLKLHFENPFGVYLHDTPDKSLFMLNRRFFSHGCMRMENPLGIGRYLLGSRSVAIDTLTEKGCLQHQQPVFLEVEQPLRLVVWYNPAGVDENGSVVFYPDIYNRLGRLLRGLP